MESPDATPGIRAIDSALRILCSHKALRPRLKCTAVLAARALRFVVFGACRGGALRGIARCYTWFREIDSALRIPCFLKALRPRLKCTAVLAARALRFVVFGACRGGALRGIARCCTWFREIDSALRIPCFLKALRPRLKCTAVLAARALRFVVFGACRGGALRGIARCCTWFREIDSALRIPCFLKALRPRLKCTAVLAARALRFVVSEHVGAEHFVESSDVTPGYPRN